MGAGDVPDEWWLASEFTEAIQMWREDAIRMPAVPDREAVWARLRHQHALGPRRPMLASLVTLDIDPFSRVAAAARARESRDREVERSIAALRAAPRWHFDSSG